MGEDMARGIIIFGSAGSGKTTFGKKIYRLMTDISKESYFVMAGSMDSFNEPFVPLFNFAVHITASVETRIACIYKREYEIFGERIVKDGDLYEAHCHFLDIAARYDLDGSPCMKTHGQWANSLHCKVLRLSGDEDLNKNSDIIVQEYLSKSIQKES